MTAETLPKLLWTRRLADYWSLTKAKQTTLLLFTGLCGYLLSRGSPSLSTALAMAGGLFLSISGCTALNMLLDRDIDAQMERTACRPLPAGRIRPVEAGLFGGSLCLAGLALSFALDWRFGALVAAGLAFDLLVYTAWLKRRTALSILFGGLAGGMPVLSGRVLALGRVDPVGLLLAASVLLWIPAHILTLALRHAADYREAGVPTWPNRYGPRATRLFVAATSLLNAVALMVCAVLLALHPVALGLLLVLGLAMAGLAALQVARPTDRRNWLLFKAASVSMLLSMLLLTIGVLR